MVVLAGELTIVATTWAHVILHALGAAGVIGIVAVVLVMVFVIWLASQAGGPFLGGWRRRGRMGR